jgi:putative DNA primase/helicase
MSKGKPISENMLREIAHVNPESSRNGHERGAKVFKATDYGNAERLVDRHCESLRYVHLWGRWLVFDGKRWTIDNSGEVQRRAKETVRGIYGEAESAVDEAQRKDLARHAVRSESQNRIDAMISLATSEPGIPICPEDLDANPWLLNVENGTIDLRTGQLRDHDRADLITNLAPVDYDDQAAAPTFAAFLETVLPSEELRRFVQRMLGYCLTGAVSEQVLFFLYGVGANGKSTLINTFLEGLGDYGKQAAPELLTAKPGTHPTELADLMGARFVPSVEVEDGRRLAESLVKQLTGGDRIKARFMRQDFFEFDPTHKVLLAANHKPVIRGTDHAIWRRIKLIPFEIVIPNEEQDKNLPEKLRAELPGILAWAVRGCLDWQRDGLAEPPQVTDATAEYREEMDTLGAFIEECCVAGPGASVKATPLYEAYKAWCEQNGETYQKQKWFGMRLTERGFERMKSGVYWWHGIGLSYDGPDNGPHAENALRMPKTQTGDKEAGPSGPKIGIGSSEDAHEAVISNVGPKGPKGPETNGGKRLSETEVSEVQRLLSQGMSAKFARAEVLRGKGQA